MSIEIGTITEVKKDDQNGLNFDHNSPIARGRNSIAIGTSSVAGGSINNDEGFKTGEAIAIGAKAQAMKEQSIAIGGDTKASGWGAIVIGGDDLTPLKGRKYGEVIIPDDYEPSEAKGDGSIVVGSQGKATEPLALAIGSVSKATGMGANAMGATANAGGNQSNAIGYNSKANAENSISLGAYAHIDNINAVNSIVIGNNSKTDKISATAIGSQASVIFDNGVAIGSGSVDKAATQVSGATIKLKNGGTIEYKGFAGDKATSVVSVGDAGNERQIVNVGAGAISDTSTDAINGSQLYAIAKTLKDDLDAINPTWKLKDSNGGSKEVGSKNGGTTGNEVTVTGKGDIAVTVNDKGMTIDGTTLKNEIKMKPSKLKMEMVRR
ncbi:hypothetical protein SE959_26550 [Escherichia coli]|nr:hypothetical protein [Escherichia coli]